MHRGDVVLAVDALDRRTGGTRSCGPGRPRRRPSTRPPRCPGGWRCRSTRCAGVRRRARAPRWISSSAWLRVVRSLARLVLCSASASLGVAGDGLLERLLVAALRHPDLHPAAAQVAEQLLERVDVRRQLGDQDLLRDRVARFIGLGAGVELEQEVLDQLGRAALLDPIGHPAALAADPAAAHVEDLHRDLERVLGEGDHVDVGAVAEHHRLLLERALHRAEVVAQPGRLLEVLAVGGGVHLPLDPPDERPGLAGHEVTEVVDDLAVVVGGDVADARRRALVDVAEQARPPDLAGALEDAVGAAPHREDPQQDVDGLADRPGVAVGAEVAGALALGAAADHHPRELVADGHGEPRVGLVVAVLHVEPRVELLDPGVLQLQRLDLGVDHRPVDAGGGGHHGGGAGVQVADVLEVRREPGPQVLRLADVDHPAARRRGTGRPRAGSGSTRSRDGTTRQPHLNPTSRSRHPLVPAWSSMSRDLLYLHAVS